MINGTDLRHNSKQTLNTTRKLNSDRNHIKRIVAVTPNEVVHQLLLNGNPVKKRYNKRMEKELDRAMSMSNKLFLPFVMSEPE